VARKTDSPGTPAIDHEAIRELARLLDETGLTEIAVERGGVSIRVARHTGGAVGRGRGAEAASPAPAVAPTPLPVDPAQHPGLVASPMVGTAYLAPEPGARPFVEIGTVVKTGEPLMIIEAMKTMNQIPAPRPGIVIQILVDDGQPVEYGQPLVIIE
jgi:acetyl-CoA carboxylase biotin carboxyl carrier protein